MKGKVWWLVIGDWLLVISERRKERRKEKVKNDKGKIERGKVWLVIFNWFFRVYSFLIHYLYLNLWSAFNGVVHAVLIVCSRNKIIIVQEKNNEIICTQGFVPR
ncbi:hypothetical protein [Marinobacterium aestuarii]|uniref:hypothetical protein n=1 Tax=Marinobacterium aestuarii TaxID=1821621 RepID=UPI0012FFBFE8|nr:hypothetical protein [Marinobacterium aestuarii]